MKKITNIFLLLLLTSLAISCSKNDDDSGISTIILSSSAETVQLGNSVTFAVKGNNDADVTSSSTFYVNDEMISSSTFTPTTAGQFTVKAKYTSGENLLVSNTLTINVTAMPVSSIVLTSDNASLEVGQTFTFTATADNQANLTADATFFVNDIEIESNTFAAEQAGNYDVKATYMFNNTLIESNVVSIVALPSATVASVFSNVVFYDGYASTVNQPVQEGVIRVNNASYVTKLNETHLDNLSNKLKISVTIGALCDNYDRIGSVFINFMPKDQAFAMADVAKRLEIGRFITPFMNKNIAPTEVPYLFDTDNVALILNDPAIRAQYDFWMELNVFGVPYAANTQVSGCAGRNDVFLGSMKFLSTDETYTHANQGFVPVATYHTVNNYSASGTDVIGTTSKTFTFNVPNALSNAKIYVVSSNHGANNGGEEYNRRSHEIYMDGALIDTYIPGGKSCEPYRQYNTQGNGIYGTGTKSLSYWTSFNNWCPGDIIPIRSYQLGSVSQGSHTFNVKIPQAQFVNGEGYVPFSVYIQGDL